MNVPSVPQWDPEGLNPHPLSFPSKVNLSNSGNVAGRPCPYLPKRKILINRFLKCHRNCAKASLVHLLLTIAYMDPSVKTIVDLTIASFTL